VDDPYLYPGTRVLRNELGLTEPRALERAEHEYVLRRMSQGLPAGDFSYAHLKAIHWHLFQDVYDWAGDARIVEMVKDDTIFCPSSHVDEQMQQISDDLAAEYQLAGLGPQAFAQRAGHYLCAINAVHPFREGNGRAQRAFLGLLAEEVGHPIDWSRITPEQMRTASIAGMSGREQPMCDLLARAIHSQHEIARSQESPQQKRREQARRQSQGWFEDLSPDRSHGRTR